MEKQRDMDIPFDVGLPEDVKREGFARAPYTISGLTAGGILGGYLLGPPGAVLVGIVGGILGLVKDEEITEGDLKKGIRGKY